MWVEVKEVDVEKREYTGTLANDPVYIADIEFGDVVKFSHDLISDTYGEGIH